MRKRRLKAAYIRLNPGRGLTEGNIEITDDGRVLTGKRRGDTYKSYLDDVTTNLARPAATAEPTVNGTYEISNCHLLMLLLPVLIPGRDHQSHLARQ